MKYISTIILSVLMMFPFTTSAATLTQNQINAIISVLMAFGVDQATINAVSLALAPVAPETSIAPLYQPTQPILDTTPPVVNLKPLANEWSRSKFFGKGLYGTAGIREWEYVRDTGTGVVQSTTNIATIEWLVDGVSVEPARAIGMSKKMAFDSTKYSNGEHTLTLTATDVAGNRSSDSIVITITNP